jgi:putative DNA primase/helicase
MSKNCPAGRPPTAEAHSADRAAQINISALKRQAAGHWREILSTFGGLPLEILDGKNHPCPKCAGTDRFRFTNLEEGGSIYCNQCNQNCGDGIASLQWLTGDTFPDTIKRLAAHLGVNGNGNHSKNVKSKIVVTYDYREEQNELLYQICRMDPKDFRQRRPKAGGEWNLTVKGVRKVPYRLPELLAADLAALVFIPEGEKDADRLVKSGLVATTNAGGAGKWEAAFAEFLVGRNVVVLADNDAAGRNHAKKVARSLVGKAASIKVIELPGLPEKGDVSDWFDAGGTVERLLRLVEEASEWQDAVAKIQSESARESFPLTDTGLAERFALQHGEDARHCFAWAKWLCWDGTRWRTDDSGMVDQLGKQTVRSIFYEAADEPNDNRREAIAKFAQASESVARRAAMLTLARSESPIPITPDVLDKNRLILNCPNGTLDLRTGKLYPHRREDFLTKVCPVAYDPDAACSMWDATLARVLNHDDDLIQFVQRFAGYSLTGDVSEQILCIWHGAGANGKSTILNALMEVLGADYAMKAGADLLLAKRDSDHPTALTDLHGKRLAVCIETDDGRRLAESLVKELTGGDPIRARRIRENFWQFMPTHKIVLACNHRPVVRGTDHAIWRRLKLVPFNVVIPADERDKQLSAKLRAELPGILAWAVRGCLDWQRHGLGEPKAIIEATAAYQDAENVILNFIAENCVTGDARVKAADLLDAYRVWSGDKSMTARKLTNFLEEQGVERFHSGGTWYRGIGLQAAE